MITQESLASSVCLHNSNVYPRMKDWIESLGYFPYKDYSRKNSVIGIVDSFKGTNNLHYQFRLNVWTLQSQTNHAEYIWRTNMVLKVMPPQYHSYILSFYVHDNKIAYHFFGSIKKTQQFHSDMTGRWSFSKMMYFYSSIVDLLLKLEQHGGAIYKIDMEDIFLENGEYNSPLFFSYASLYPLNKSIYFKNVPKSSQNTRSILKKTDRAESPFEKIEINAHEIFLTFMDLATSIEEEVSNSTRIHSRSRWTNHILNNSFNQVLNSIKHKKGNLCELKEQIELLIIQAKDRVNKENSPVLKF